MPTDFDVSQLYRLDDQLAEEERAARDAVARFIDRSVLPIIGQHFREGRFPRQLVPEIASLGILGAPLQG